MCFMASQKNDKTRSCELMKKPFPLSKSQKNGEIIQINQTISTEYISKKKYCFTDSTFNKIGEWLAIVDLLGNIFIFDLASELYWNLPKVGECSFIKFNDFVVNELLVGLNDGDIYIIHSETGMVQGCLSGHSQPVRHVSFASSVPYCLTATNIDAVVWDLQLNVQLQKLNLQCSTAIKIIKFMPATNNILGCFEDDTIHIWKSESLKHLNKFVLDELEVSDILSIAFTRSGRAMVIINGNGDMAVFSLDLETIQKAIFIPNVCADVSYIDFLPQIFDGGANKILAVQSTRCILLFNIETLEIENTFDIEDRLIKIECSPHGKYISCILQDGNVKILSTDILQKTIKQTIDSHKKDEISTTKYDDKIKTINKTQQDLNSIQTEMTKILNIEKLLPLLKQFGEYPEKYRRLIWKNLLQLPGNQVAYETLERKGIHSEYNSLEEKYPLKNKTLLRNLLRILSCLSHWTPFFSQVKYMPVFVLPFLKVFKYDRLVCFEIIASIIVNWCQLWFEYFPLPPVKVLSIVDDVLLEHDSELSSHLTRHKITPDVYAWPLFETAFSEVLNKEDWLRFWDHVLSNHPAFLVLAVAAFNLVSRTALLSMKEKEDFENFFFKEILNVKLLIKKTYSLLSYTSEENHPKQYIKPFQKLEKGCTYQEFTQYTKNMPQVYKLQDLRNEENKLIEEQRKILEKKLEYEADRKEQRMYKINKNKVLDLEDVYKNILKEEEHRIANHRMKIAELKHDLKVQEYNILEQARSKMIGSKTMARKTQLEKLLEDIDKQRKLDELELQTVKQETRNNYLDLLKKKKILEMELDIDGEQNDTDYLSLMRHQNVLRSLLLKLRHEVSNGYSCKKSKVTTFIVIVEDILHKIEMILTTNMEEIKSKTNLKKIQKKIAQLNVEAGALEEEVEILLKDLLSYRMNKSSTKFKSEKPLFSDKAISNTQCKISCSEDIYKPIKASMNTRRQILKKKKGSYCYC